MEEEKQTQCTEDNIKTWRTKALITAAPDPKQNEFENQSKESWKRNQWRLIMEEESLEEES